MSADDWWLLVLCNFLKEGTTNVLSMDLIRVLTKTNGRASKLFLSVIARRCASAAKSSNEQLKAAAATLEQALQALQKFLVSCVCMCTHVKFTDSNQYPHDICH